jgi:FixJ family two-component response regulator
MTEPNQSNVLSRDHELLRMLAQGCSNEEIASFLNVSQPTQQQKKVAQCPSMSAMAIFRQRQTGVYDSGAQIVEPRNQ